MATDTTRSPVGLGSLQSGLDAFINMGKQRKLEGRQEESRQQLQSMVGQPGVTAKFQVGADGRIVPVITKESPQPQDPRKINQEVFDRTVTVFKTLTGLMDDNQKEEFSENPELQLQLFDGIKMKVVEELSAGQSIDGNANAQLSPEQQTLALLQQLVQLGQGQGESTPASQPSDTAQRSLDQSLQSLLTGAGMTSSVPLPPGFDPLKSAGDFLTQPVDTPKFLRPKGKRKSKSSSKSKSKKVGKFTLESQ